MTFGTGPQALVDLIETNWQATRAGREDVPAIVSDPDTEFGVLVTRDRQEVRNQYAVHDLIHCYHPEASGLTFTDKGYDEEGTTEQVQIDVECTDRTDPDTGERLNADARLVGDRDSGNFPADETPPYPGLLGETKYVLEEKRRGMNEWDVVRVDVVNLFLGSSNANVSFSVDLEHVAKNTVQ